MVLSLRDVARRRLGVRGSFSVNRQVYGYPFAAADGSTFGTLTPLDILPGSGTPLTRSLTRHLRLIEGPAINLTLILVDHEDDFTGAVSRAQVAALQYAVQVTRDLFAQQSLGVRNLDWRRIPRADAGGFADIDRAEGKSLTDAWSGPPGGIDVFLVQTISDADGWSYGAGAGPCDKNDTTDLSGVLVQLDQDAGEAAPPYGRILGIILAHEVGHYLGLGHTTSTANLMGDDSDGDGVGAVDNGSTALSASEGTTMRAHCSVVS